jgi:hypothetical protein
MKKLILLVLCMVLIGVGSAMANTLTYTNNTQARTQTGAIWTPGLLYIGDADKFKTTQASFETSGVNAGLLTITTNWDPLTNDGFLGTTTAMLFIDKDGNSTWDYAINLDYKNTNKNLAAVYQPTLVYQSTDVYYNTHTYGKYYNVADNNHLIPVIATAVVDNLDPVYVTWAYGIGHDNNTVTVDLSQILGSGPWSFIWGTATCGNGPITHGFDTGVVPLPPSVLLLGSGLLGLGLLGWRRRKEG